MPVCVNQSYAHKPGQTCRVPVTCKATNDWCVCQYWCQKDAKYKLTDRAPVVCKKFKEIK